MCRMKLVLRIMVNYTNAEIAVIAVASVDRFEAYFHAFLTENYHDGYNDSYSS